MEDKPSHWWEGGYIRKSKRGPVYVIDRRVSGVHFHVSTRAHSRTAALKHLERFESNPDAYKPADGRVGVALTAELVIGYCTWLLDVKKVTDDWAQTVGRVLGEWTDDLAGKDLRKLDLQQDIKPILARRPTTRHHRVTALKGLFKWLRREKGLLKHHEDVSLDLAVPKIAAAKLSRKKVVAVEVVRACVQQLPAAYRDVMVMLVGTGWHLSEVRRFASSGELVRTTQPGVIAVAVTKQKNGRLTRTGLRLRETFDAAERIRAAGHVASNRTLEIYVHRACEAAGVQRFNPGVMRHSVATWGIEAGADMKTVSEFLDHQSKKTTDTFYVDTAHAKPGIPIMRMLD